MLFLDDDVVLEADLIARLLKALRGQGCGLFPYGAYHQELPTTVPQRDVDAPPPLRSGLPVPRRRPLRQSLPDAPRRAPHLRPAGAGRAAAGPVPVLQPGATDRRRWWPAERFAAVGDALADEGAVVVVQGDGSERLLTAEMVAAMRRPAIDAGGCLSLGALAALLARTTRVVGNDSGPQPLAQAMGCASVGVYGFTNLLVSGPPSVVRHRHALSLCLHCPVCGRENVHQRCPHDPSCVADVRLDEVLRLARALWTQEIRAPAAPAPP